MLVNTRTLRLMVDVVEVEPVAVVSRVDGTYSCKHDTHAQTSGQQRASSGQLVRQGRASRLIALVN